MFISYMQVWQNHLIWYQEPCAHSGPHTNSRWSPRNTELDWVGARMRKSRLSSKSDAFLSLELALVDACVLCTWTLHLAHTEVHTADGQDFHHSAQLNWPSIAHTCSRGVVSESQELRGSQNQNQPVIIPICKAKYKPMSPIIFCCNPSLFIKLCSQHVS